MITRYPKTNKIYNTIGAGDVNVIKDVGLREITMTIVLPNDLTLPFVQSKYMPSAIIGKPIVYLSKFLDIKANKKPIQLLISRVLLDGSEIFEGNILVTLEEYNTYEKAGEEGDFIVDLTFKEYRPIKQKTFEVINEEKSTFTVAIKRTTKNIAKTYKVKPGDTLWKIAKRELNDETLYKKIMKLNGITEPRNLQVGIILKLE